MELKWSRIATKLSLSILILFFIIVLTVGFVLEQLVTGFYKNQIYTEAEDLSNRVISMMGMHNHETPQMFRMMTRLTGGDIHLLNRNGEHIFITQDSDFPHMASLNNKTIERLSQGITIQYETLNAKNERYLVSAKPLLNQYEFVGALYLFSPLENMYDSIQKIRKWMVLSGIGAMFLAVGFMYVASSQLTKPLLQMERAARRMSKGELDIKVTAQTKDEIGSLATAINDLAHDLKQHRDTRTEFFANISHELRTPVTYLQGYSDILQKKLYDTEDEKLQYIRVIHEETGRLNHMIQDLFDLAKMDEGQFSMKPEQTDLAQVLMNCTQRIELRAKEKGISLIQIIEEKKLLMEADPRRLEQIFMNLLDNAIRYTEQGSIKVEAYSIDDSIGVVIKDTGVGIPKDELALIFERFYRVEKSRSRELGGTGLGLAIVKKLVELQAGTIEVSSEWGKGTEIKLIFPGLHTDSSYRYDTL